MRRLSARFTACNPVVAWADGLDFTAWKKDKKMTHFELFVHALFEGYFSCISPCDCMRTSLQGREPWKRPYFELLVYAPFTCWVCCIRPNGGMIRRSGFHCKKESKEDDSLWSVCLYRAWRLCYCINWSRGLAWTRLHSFCCGCWFLLFLLFLCMHLFLQLCMYSLICFTIIVVEY